MATRAVVSSPLTGISTETAQSVTSSASDGFTLKWAANIFQNWTVQFRLTRLVANSTSQPLSSIRWWLLPKYGVAGEFLKMAQMFHRLTRRLARPTLVGFSHRETPMRRGGEAIPLITRAASASAYFWEGASFFTRNR